MRIDETICRAERAAKNIVRPKLRHHRHDVFRRNPFNVSHTERILPFAVCFQISKMIFVRRAEEISMRSIIRRVAHHVVELRKEVDRILRHLDIDRRRELRAHAAHALPGRALALMRLPPDRCACRTGDFRGPIGRVVVVHIDPGLRQSGLEILDDGRDRGFFIEAGHQHRHL